MMKMSSLRTFDISYLLIDEDHIAHLKNMKFPSLFQLICDSNSIKDEEGKLFINKKTMPKLKVLSIQRNFLTSNFIAHLNK